MLNALTFALAIATVGVLGGPTSNSSSIPSDISTSCSKFLADTLQGSSSSTLSTCLKSVSDATSAKSASLDSFCSATAVCTDTVLRTTLSSFYSACGDELTSSKKNTDVVAIYDNLYAVVPMRSTLCSKDDTGNYCVSTMGSKYLNGQESAVQRVLNDATTINADSWSKYGIAFGFLNKDVSKDVLCQSCTRKIITAYTTWESDIAYAPGLSTSPLLSSQTDLYKTVSDQCGSDFLKGAVVAAGSLGNGSNDGNGALSVSISTIQALLASMGAIVFTIVTIA